MKKLLIIIIINIIAFGVITEAHATSKTGGYSSRYPLAKKNKRISAKQQNKGKPHYTKGYYKKDGTYVAPHKVGGSKNILGL